MASTRRLAAILAADVPGYSRLMGADEEGTHERLRAHRRELVEPKIGEHSGRVVKNTGDGMLVEFPSVVDAVRCAAELQRSMIEDTPGPPHQVPHRDLLRRRHRRGRRHLWRRVNVAARLEALAEPGGICISRMARDQIRDKLRRSRRAERQEHSSPDAGLCVACGSPRAGITCARRSADLPARCAAPIDRRVAVCWVPMMPE
jgi:adenylate cyclase